MQQQALAMLLLMWKRCGIQKWIALRSIAWIWRICLFVWRKEKGRQASLKVKKSSSLPREGPVSKTDEADHDDQVVSINMTLLAVNYLLLPAFLQQMSHADNVIDYIDQN